MENAGHWRGAGPGDLNRGYFARESPDGKWLYYSKFEQGGGFWRIPLPAHGPEQRVADSGSQDSVLGGGHMGGWSSRAILLPSEEEDSLRPFPPVRAVDLVTGRTRDLQTGNKLLGRGLCLSPDGKWLVRTQIDRAQSLIMIAE